MLRARFGSLKSFFEWLNRLPEEYKSRHADPVSCQVLRGPVSEVGSEIECQEFLHDKLHSMRLRVTKVIPDGRIEFVVGGMGDGAFEVPQECG